MRNSLRMMLSRWRVRGPFLQVALTSVAISVGVAACAKFSDRYTEAQGTALDQHGHPVKELVVTLEIDGKPAHGASGRANPDGSFLAYAIDQPESRFFSDKKPCELVLSAPGFKSYRRQIRLGSRVEGLRVSLLPIDPSLEPPRPPTNP